MYEDNCITIDNKDKYEKFLSGNKNNYIYQLNIEQIKISF